MEIFGANTGQSSADADQGDDLIKDATDQSFIEDVIEPFLIQQGYLMRTPRGRVATPLVYQHFGLKPQEGTTLEQSSLALED